jgi:hypothetical protein
VSASTRLTLGFELQAAGKTKRIQISVTIKDLFMEQLLYKIE